MFCTQAKEFLRANSVAFEERDVTTDPGALEALQKLGYLTTPVIVINGAPVVGFDRARLQALLDNAAHP